MTFKERLDVADGSLRLLSQEPVIRWIRIAENVAEGRG
jgi:hypothetical protein